MKKFMLFCFILIFLLNPKLITLSSTKFNVNDLKTGIIIITSVDIKIFDNYVSYKKNQGYNVKVVNIKEIKEKTTGIDTPEKIRNWLIKNSQSDDKYLILVGDPIGKYKLNSTEGDIPLRIAYPFSHEWIWNVPTLYYYSDLEGNWDKDKDGWYGEFNDDEIKLNPKFSVSLIPTSDINLISKIFNNIIEYENNYNIKSTLLTMGDLFPVNMKLEHGYICVDYSYLGEYLKEKYLSDITEVSTLYEKEGLCSSSFECSMPLNGLNFTLSFKNKDLVISRLEGAGFWKEDTNKNNIPDQSEIIRKKIIDIDKIISDNPLKVFCLFDSWSADPFNGTLKNLYLNNKIGFGIGFSSGAVMELNSDWFDINNREYVDKLIILFTKFLTNGESIGDSIKDIFNFYDKYKKIDEYDLMNLLGLTLYGDPTYVLFKKPVINMPSYIEFNCFENIKKLDIENIGDLIFEWDIKKKPDFLTLLKSEGKIKGHQKDFIDIMVEKEIIPVEEGQFEDTIVLNSNIGEFNIKIKVIVDKIKPILNLDPINEITNKKTIILKGKVYDNVDIKELKINSEEVIIDKNKYFETNLELNEGENQIKFELFDICGNKTEKIINIILDTKLPVILFYPPSEVYDPVININGTVNDEGLSGIKDNLIYINGVKINLVDSKFSYTLNLNEGLNNIKIEIEDNAGNKLIKEYQIRYIKRITLKLQIGNKIMYVNDSPQEIDVPPQIVEGRTYLPIKYIVEPLGGEISWDGTEKKVTITLKDTTIELWIGKNIARVNGLYTPIDSNNPKVVPMIIQGRTMLPVRFVAENLGCDVQWDSTTKTIIILYLNK